MKQLQALLFILQVQNRAITKNGVLMYIMLWALGPITLLIQHTYTCTALYLYRTLMPPI